MALTKKILHLAFIMSDDGKDLIKVQKIDPRYNTFNTDKQHTYIFNPAESTIIVKDSWYYWTQKRYYYYNVSNPEPLFLKKERRSTLSAEELNIFIDTEVLRNLNDLSKPKWWTNLLTPTNIIIAIVVMGLLYWYFGIMKGKIG